MSATAGVFPQPRPARLALGFATAPFAATLTCLLADRGGQLPLSAIADDFPLLLIGAYGQAVFLALPAYWVLRRLVRPMIPNILATGAIVAVLPWLAIFATSKQSTPAWAAATGFGQLLLAGAVGGLAFWLCTVWRDPRLDPRAAA